MKSLNVQNGFLAQVTKGHIVDVVAREVFDGEIIMNDGKIEEIRRCRLDGSRQYHNIVAIGLDDEALVRAVNRVIEMRGGLVVVSPDEVLDLPLPIAGLMSPMSGYEIALRNILLHEKVRSIGSSMHSPFVTMSFMCLAVIPELKITDKFLLDTKMMQPILRRR